MTTLEEQDALGDALPRWVPAFVTEPGYSLVEAIDMARRGEFTAAGPNAPVRLLYVGWVWTMLLAVLVVTCFAVWATVRPTRFLAVVLIGTAVATMANLIPILAPLVPDVLTLPGLWAAVTGWWSS